MGFRLGLFVIFFVCAIGVWGDYERPVDRYGQLRVEGAHIVDTNGRPVALKGISLGWHNWWPQYYNASVVEHLSRKWRISVIRAAMGVEPEGAYLDNPESAETLIKTVIDAAIENGIYVIVDWHSHDLYTEQAETFFAYIAQQYANYPNIIYEIVNEPENKYSREIKWPEIKEYSERIIQTIRKFDEKNLIIVGSSTCSQDVDIVADDPITGYSNVVYSLHFYAASHEYVRYKARYAVSKGLPLFVSECSPAESDGNGKLDKKRFTGWLDFMQQNDIGFVLWGLYDKAETSAMLKPGANTDGRWPVSQLTEMGYYSRRLMRGGVEWNSIVPLAGLLLVGIALVLIRKIRK